MHDFGLRLHESPAPGALADSRCPRCGGAFHCGAYDAAPCPCTTLKLDAATLAALNTQYRGCLCLGCLAELARGAAAASSA